MTAYYVIVAADLMPWFRSGDGMPTCLHLVRELGPADPPYQDAIWVELEDDEAGAELAGKVIALAISTTFDGTTPSGYLVSERLVEAHVAPPAATQ